jgi:hypothetical protein
MRDDLVQSDTRTPMDSSSHTNDRTFKLRERFLDEARRFAVMFLYLWVLFGLFVLNERIILDQRGIGFSSHGFALLNALVLAKVMLVTEDLNLGRWMRRRPLIYPILFESLLLTIMFICFHVAEHFVVGLVERETVAASIPAIGGGGLAGVVCVAVILFVALIPFFAFRNVSRELAPGQLNAMLFGTAIKAAGDQ